MSRPHLKHEVVSHWQKNFNNFADDMRNDDESKAELHLRLNVTAYNDVTFTMQIYTFMK